MTNSTAMADYRMAHFLAAHGVIVACVNYRLGFFGFFAHKDLEDENGSCGNYALYDIKQAAEWMKENAEAFGGDPDNITIGGQSGGAFASNLMLVSPLMKGIAKRIIIQSGTCFHGMMQPKTKEQAEAEADAFCKKHNVTVEDLKKMDPTDIIRMTAEERFVPNAIVDGTFIAEMPQDTLIKGNMNKVDILVTATAREFAAHLTEDTVSPEGFEEYVKEKFGDNAEKILSAYPHSTGAEAGKAYFSLLGDLHFVGVIRTAEECAKHGLNTYAGYFTRPVSGEDGELVGAIHSSELPYLFGRINHGGKTQLGFVPWLKADFEHAEAINTMWTNFMSGGNPGGGWKKFENRFDILDIGRTRHMLSGEDAARLQLCYNIITGDTYGNVGQYIDRRFPMM
ncbi:MAG: carboxylesterase family protein, partial [Clostridia bacterium]|nr:carboxylesterase family protein [Clostridia bacterium]